MLVDASGSTDQSPLLDFIYPPPPPLSLTTVRLTTPVPYAPLWSCLYQSSNDDNLSPNDGMLLRIHVSIDCRVGSAASNWVRLLIRDFLSLSYNMRASAVTELSGWPINAVDPFMDLSELPLDVYFLGFGGGELSVIDTVCGTEYYRYGFYSAKDTLTETLADRPTSAASIDVVVTSDFT